PKDATAFSTWREQNLTLNPENTMTEVAEAPSRHTELQAMLVKQAAEKAYLETELARARTYATTLAREREMARSQLQWMLASTSWRLTGPLRARAMASPKLAKYGRRLANSLWLRKTSQAGRRAAPRPVSERIHGGLPSRDQLERLVKTAEARAMDGRLLEPSGLLNEANYRAGAKLDPTVNAAEHYLTMGWRQGLEPGPRFEGAFLHPYFASAGFTGPPAITYLTLRDAGWPVYATRADAEAI